MPDTASPSTRDRCWDALVTAITGQPYGSLRGEAAPAPDPLEEAPTFIRWWMQDAAKSAAAGRPIGRVVVMVQGADGDRRTATEADKRRWPRQWTEFVHAHEVPQTDLGRLLATWQRAVMDAEFHEHKARTHRYVAQRTGGTEQSYSASCAHQHERAGEDCRQRAAVLREAVEKMLDDMTGETR